MISCLQQYKRKKCLNRSIHQQEFYQLINYLIGSKKKSKKDKMIQKKQVDLTRLFTTRINRSARLDFKLRFYHFMGQDYTNTVLPLYGTRLY